MKDHFDHWLSDDAAAAKTLLDHVIEPAEERLRRRQEKEIGAQERDAQAAPARQARRLHAATAARAPRSSWSRATPPAARPSRRAQRETQAMLPLRGKILNVASASADKLRGNQELADLVQALGCGTGATFDEAKLRYERVIIMTDADVDGAHIASLLMTFFYREMPKLIETGHLFLAHAAALPAERRRHRDLRARRRAQGRAHGERASRARARSRSAASRASARCRRRSSRKRRWSPASARCCG